MKRQSKIAPEPSLPGLTGVVGIDVAKSKFDACYLLHATAKPAYGTFSSDDIGLKKFTQWLNRVSAGVSVHLCLEETGTYGRALAAFLHQSGHHVSIVNAALIKNFGGSLNVRTKNDRVDAHLIAQYTLERSPERWVPLPSQHQAVRDVARRREQIIELILKEQNHLEAAQSPTVRAHIEANIAHLKGQEKAIKIQLQKLINEDDMLAHQQKLLCTIPNIGLLTAAVLIAELPPLDSFPSARTLSAYAGLTPRETQSGSSVKGRGRLCKQGRGALRKLMFMPAIGVLKMKSGPLKAFADRLLNASKPKAKMCVIGALMRKLISLAFAIVRSNQPYDPNYRGPMKTLTI